MIAMYRSAANTIWRGGRSNSPSFGQDTNKRGANLAPLFSIGSSVDLDIDGGNDGISHRQAVKQLAKVLLYPADIDQ